MSRGAPAHHRNDDVRKRRPRMIEIELRRPRRMIGMRMVEPEQFRAEARRALLGQPIVRRPHQEPAARAFFRRIRQRERSRHAIAVRRSARRSIRAERFLRRDGGSRASTAAGNRQPTAQSFGRPERSVRYFSAPSGNTVTIDAVVEPARDLERGRERGAGRNAREQPFFPRQTANHVDARARC